MSQKTTSDSRNVKVVTADPTPALSAMSIQYDSSKQQASTYQQPAASISKPNQGYQQSYNRPYTAVLQPAPAAEPIERQPQLSLKDLRGLQTAADGSFKRPNTANADRRPSAVQQKLATRRRSSTSGGTSRPTLNHASTSDLTYTKDLYAPSSSYYAHTHREQQQPQQHQPQIQPQNSYHRSRGSVSSESSYAASEVSDVLYNSANGRSSSGGTTATTPGGSDREKERSLSLRHPVISPPRVSPAPVERIPVPSPMVEDKRPQLVHRPNSQTSTVAMSERSAFSPALSQTSSMIRKTSSRYTLSDFNFIRTLGTGSFGRVHLVRSCHNTRFYAIKVLNKERVVRMKQVEHTNSEREMLERVRHPFLVNLWGTFKDAQNLYMVMDFVSGGELFSLLRKSQVSFHTISYWRHSLKFGSSASRTQSPSSLPPKSLLPSITFTPSTSSTAISSLKTSC